MGGSALRMIEARRLTAAEYRPVARRVLVELATAWPGSRPHLLRSYADKPDFGDIDVVVDAAGLPQDVHGSLSAMFGSVEVFENVSRRNMAWSCDVEGAQLDIIGMASEDYPTAIVYYSDNDLGNLMGCVAHRMGFKYGHDGLSYRLRDGTRVIADLEVSREPARIFEFLGYTEPQYDFARFRRGFKTLDGIFHFVASSRFFSPDAFLPENRNSRRRARDRSRKNYVAFVDWMQKGGIAPGSAAGLPSESHLARAKMLFPRFAIDLAVAHRADIRAQRRAEVFNGHVVSEIAGISGPSLGLLMELIKARFRCDASGFDAWVGTLTGSSDPRLTEAVHEARETLLAGLGKDLSISETHSQA